MLVQRAIALEAIEKIEDYIGLERRDLLADQIGLRDAAIQHLANLTPRHRRARFEKYLEADPDNRFQPSYANLLDPPGELKLWERRPPDLAVVANGSSNGGWPS